MRIHVFYIICLSSLCVMSCGYNTSKQQDSRNELLAKVGKHELYKSDLEGFSLEGKSGEDSLAILNSYVEQWVRRKAVLEYAENTVSSELDIPKLVEEYRASLLLHNYRQNLIGEKLDTSVSDEQLQNFYDVNKEHYRLADPIMRGMIAIFDAKQRGLEKFDRHWKRDKYHNIENFASKNALLYQSDTATWLSQEDFFTVLPPDKIRRSRLGSNKNFQFNNDGKEYFVKVVEYVGTDRHPPLAYVKDKLKKVILNTRKKQLLRRIEYDIYNNALEANRIKVYTK